MLTENCCCVSSATALVRGASLTLGRLAVSDPLRRYRGDVATGRRSLEAFEGAVVTVWEMVGRASKNRNAQTLFDDMQPFLTHIVEIVSLVISAWCHFCPL
jgi:hypothetical protein